MINILVIEDKLSAREALERVIQSSKYNSDCLPIDYAETFQEAVEKLKTPKKYHLIFWDIQLDVPSYLLWEYFPSNAFIYIFSDETDVLGKITDIYNSIDKPNVGRFKPEAKKLINKKADDKTLEIMKDKLDIFTSSGISSIHMYIEKAVKRFNSQMIRIEDVEKKPHNILEQSIVFIINPTDKYFYFENKYGSEVKGVNELLKGRKIVVLKDRIYIFSGGREDRGLDNFVKNKLQIHNKSFLKINDSMYMNAEMIFDIVQHEQSYELFMDIEEILPSAYYDETKRLYSNHAMNVVSIQNTKENQKLISDLRLMRPELFLF